MAIRNVYVWDNGMVMVFDENGQQMPDYQARIDEVWSEIERDKDSDTVFHGRWPDRQPSLRDYCWRGGLNWRDYRDFF